MTKREHIKILAKNLLLRLEQDGSIAVNPPKRQNCYDALFSKIANLILTEEDVRERVHAQLGAKAEDLAGNDSSESDQFRAAKAVLVARIGDHEVHKLYYQRPLKDVGTLVCDFLMTTADIEEVFASDEDLEKSTVDFLKKFDPAQLH